VTIEERNIMRKILSAALFTSLAAPLVAGDLHGRVASEGETDNANAVVYVAALPGKTFTPPREHATVDQTNRVFQPQVLPILVGTTVDFTNSDPYGHNVFTPAACADKFNLGTFPKGEKRSHTFKKDCFATLLCIVHPEMEGFVAVLPTPYFAVTAADGSYVIRDVPDGSYTVKVWHPKLKGTEKPVAVHGATQADFRLAR
jgi:plastocyanin